VARQELEAWLLDRSRTPAIAEFGTADGILNLETGGGSQPEGFKGRDGRLWFSTKRGLAVVDPAECPASLPPPQVMIESIVADGQALPVAASLRLPPGGGRHLDIRFTTTSLHSPDRVRIRYQLEGQDPGWRDAGSIRQASYANLRPGQYRFRVQARNHEGRWSEHDAIIAFNLAPFFWQTWAAYIIGGVAVAGVAGGLIAGRLRQQRRRLEVAGVKALEQERLRIARDMHDHLGPQLAGIALSADESQSAHQKARETLRELNDLIWSVHPNNDTLASLADFIGNFAGRYLSTAKMELDLDLPARIPSRAIPSPVRHEIAAMFKEALRNVIQHADAKRVVIRMEIAEDRLVLIVRDDGRGFESSAKQSLVNTGDTPRPASRGNGLRNFHSRSKGLRGSCRVQSAPGRGTEVEFVVPLNSAN
jgi:signal transduction histidine kinase